MNNKPYKKDIFDIILNVIFLWKRILCLLSMLVPSSYLLGVNVRKMEIFVSDVRTGGIPAVFKVQYLRS